MKDFSALKECILNTIRLKDILISEGHITGRFSEEQLSCPFHGVDNKKSARYYEETDTTWCWVCHEKLDIFSYIGKRESISFSETLNYIINQYKIDISSVPEQMEVLIDDNNIKEKKKSLSNRHRYVSQLKEYILKKKGVLEPYKYGRFVYIYMVMKNVISNEKFPEEAVKINEAILRTERKLKNV